MSDGKYQFPNLSWDLGTHLMTCVEHGLYLRNEGRWVIPDFQRPLVWTIEQETKFLESLVLGLPVGEYTLYEVPDYTYEVLDGQQRWNAIFRYTENKFPVFGLYFGDLNAVTVRSFKMLPFGHRLVKNMTYEQRRDAYLRLAYGGTPHGERGND